MNLKKIKTIIDQQRPCYFKNIQAFLSFINFYQRFIKEFSYLTRPLIELTKKLNSYNSYLLPNRLLVALAFKKLKQAFIKVGTLAHFNLDLEIQLEIDSSNFIIAAILSQMHNSVLRLVTFLLYKILLVECNYKIYNKKLLAII